MGFDDLARHHFRTFHGVKVRVHPETHPRQFSKDSLRFRTIRENLELAMKCIPITERRLYAYLAPALAHVLWQEKYFSNLEGGGEVQVQLDFPSEEERRKGFTHYGGEGAP